MSENDYEALINALIDGELREADVAELQRAAERDPDLAATLREALELQQMLAGMPQRKAPGSLRKRLLAVPADEADSPFWYRWARPGFVAGGALLVLVLVLVESGGPGTPSPREIEQGRRELALALGYLGQAGERVSATLDNRIDSALVEPLTDQTAELFSRTPVLNEEYEL